MIGCAVATGLPTVANTFAVLERQLGKEKVRFARADRAFLAALPHRLPVGPDTILRTAT
jgi:hypothetical protein